MNRIKMKTLLTVLGGLAFGWAGVGRTHVHDTPALVRDPYHRPRSKGSTRQKSRKIGRQRLATAHGPGSVMEYDHAMTMYLTAPDMFDKPSRNVEPGTRGALQFV